jgi:hypothetical protein
MVKGASIPGVFTGDGVASQSGMPPYPALPGWPIVNILGGASPPVAADLDPGYPGLEVAVGTLSSGSNLYVFHADGTTMAGWPRSIGFFVASSPSIGDLDDDGDLEVVAGSFGSNSVWALHHDGTTVAGWPIAVGANVRSTAAIADLDPAFQGLEVVIGVQDGSVLALHHDGTAVPGWPVTAGNFVERCSPAVGDVDLDGDLEVFVGSWFDFGVGSTGGLYAFDADGTPLPGWPQLTMPATSVVASPALADLDGDDDLEIVTGTYETNAKVYVWHHTGELMTGWPQAIPRQPASSSGMTSSPAIGDLDNDGDLEIVTGSMGQCGIVYAWHHTGGLVTGWPVLVSPVVDGSSPVLGDVDGDGAADIVVGSGSGFTPLGCTLNEPSMAYAFDGQGMVLDGWPFTFAGPASVPSPALADVDQDADLDVIFAFANLLTVWDAPAAVDPLRLHWPFFGFDVAHAGVYRDPGTAGAAEAAPVPAGGVTVAPNPSAAAFRIAWANARSGWTELAIFDAAGRRTRDLTPGEAVERSQEVVWDGRDASGRKVPAAVYFARLMSARETRVIKLVVTR